MTCAIRLKFFGHVVDLEVVVVGSVSWRAKAERVFLFSSESVKEGYSVQAFFFKV